MIFDPKKGIHFLIYLKFFFFRIQTSSFMIAEIQVIIIFFILSDLI
jgi:hypothetical protein